MKEYDENYYIDIPDEIFLEDKNYILNYNLEQIKYLVKQFFIARALDKHFNKASGYHFNNELIPIVETDEYTDEFIKVTGDYSYKINRIDNLIIDKTDKSIIKKEILDMCKKSELEQKDMQIYMNLLYMLH